MTRRRWIADTFSPEPPQHPETAALLGEQAVHLARVLRAEPGQIFDVVAAGFLHRAEVTGVSVQPGAERVDFLLHEELDSDSALPVHLLLAVYKFDHLEWALEKATELGVMRITPIVARRTDKHLANAAPKRAERWRRILHEAAQQSRRTGVPSLDDPMPLKAALAAMTAPVRILLNETEQALTLPDLIANLPQPGGVEATSHALAIGPEGGWTADELGLFAAQEWHSITLGPRILRAETAAIAAIAILGSLLG